MNVEKLRRFCLSLPHATEDVKWEKDLTFCIGEKMFAVAGLEPGPAVMSFKCTPDKFAELTEKEGVIPAPYLARYHWVALESYEAIPEEDLEQLVADSYRMVFEKLPKTIQKKLSD
ncbi:MAG: MmcQ/YjbR family DNA-binding protein [Acidobacteria bacterium]|nr:MAG: MmcQ/YjbR family DNA-binding protein [Acidobacteriota bacterium]REJ98138.1 MAG: MmcQ/YjbR family DNA-binding protein [Acidobacteriota bacterium]REK16881.1 MAG: MmcQ/YjbR family DNA-binding protein [Acidobacteriota bacterium]REK42792.1 MAG: MmcQ/YjbR family DNA-binding protein [Acidobacteriota bacterium]